MSLQRRLYRLYVVVVVAKPPLADHYGSVTQTPTRAASGTAFTCRLKGNRSQNNWKVIDDWIKFLSVSTSLDQIVTISSIDHKKQPCMSTSLLVLIRAGTLARPLVECSFFYKAECVNLHLHRLWCRMSSAFHKGILALFAYSMSAHTTGPCQGLDKMHAAFLMNMYCGQTPRMSKCSCVVWSTSYLWNWERGQISVWVCLSGSLSKQIFNLKYRH